MPVSEQTKRERLGSETFPILIVSIPLRHQRVEKVRCRGERVAREFCMAKFIAARRKPRYFLSKKPKIFDSRRAIKDRPYILR